jgi:hypothetical protein
MMSTFVKESERTPWFQDTPPQLFHWAEMITRWRQYLVINLSSTMLHWSPR